MARKRTASPDGSCCPLTSSRRLRLASDQEIGAIKECFPKGIPRPALRALFAAGLTSLEQLDQVSESELLALHGMGPKAMTLLKAGLNQRGLTFRS